MTSVRRMHRSLSPVGSSTTDGPSALQRATFDPVMRQPTDGVRAHVHVALCSTLGDQHAIRTTTPAGHLCCSAFFGVRCWRRPIILVDPPSTPQWLSVQGRSNGLSDWCGRIQKCKSRKDQAGGGPLVREGLAFLAVRRRFRMTPHRLTRLSTRSSSTACSGFHRRPIGHLKRH